MRKLFIALVVASACALLATVAVGVGIWRSLNRPWAGWSGPGAEVALEPGLSAAAMLDRLAGHGVIENPEIVRVWVWVSGQARTLQAGEYRFDEPISPLAVLDRLRRGEIVLRVVTLPEGLVLEEIAERLVAAGLGETEGMLAALRNPSLIHDLDPEAVDLEGYLFPDTYQFALGSPPESIAAGLVERFRSVIGEDYGSRAAIAGLDLRGAVTLASLIERETGVATERSRVSRVFHNRLGRGMKLECDPTVLYALRRAGRPATRLTYRDLRFESPWNTYRNPGLPPGPIANPGRESLMAAVEPAVGSELYFVASPGGGHRFSNTLADHLEAVAAWRTHSRSSR